MKNKHENNSGNTINILNTLREPDHEYVELYTKNEKTCTNKTMF